MATDPRAALDRLVAAFHAHLEAATVAQDPESDAVLDAAANLVDAFDAYDEALYEATGVDTPFDVLDDDEDDDDDLDDDDEDDPDDDEASDDVLVADDEELVEDDEDDDDLDDDEDDEPLS